MASREPSDSPPQERSTDDPAAGVRPDLSGDRLRHIATAERKVGYTPTYTKLVRRLRVILPVVAVVTVAIVALWPRIRAELNRPTQTSPEERQARMINGRFVGSDSHGRPYTVTYDSAQQPPNGGPVDMVNPVAELTLQNGRWVAVKASRGVYDQSGATLDLTGQVELFHDAGYHFSTEHAHVEFNKNLIWGDRAVEGNGPKGAVNGRGFRVVNNGDAITFTGPGRLLLRPDAARMPPPGEAR